MDGDDEEEAPEDKSPFGGLLKALGTVTMKAAAEPGQPGTIVPSKAISGKKTGTTAMKPEVPAKGGFFGFGTKAVQVSLSSAHHHEWNHWDPDYAVAVSAVAVSAVWQDN